MRRLTVLAPLLFVACTPRASERSEPLLALEPCQLHTPSLPARVAAECGSWSVFENRAAGRGRRIALRVAVVPAVSRSPAPDPLVFLTGGPGQAASESYVSVESAFRAIHKERDIVLVDQRGTGQSNPLRCEKPENATELWLLDDDTMKSWLTRCLEELDADPRFYTTSLAMEDLDEVRGALGYERVNLYGISYGTRAALSYLRQFPDRVRSVILDGIAPPTEALGLDVARDAQRALDLLMARCRDDVSCRDAFPSLDKDLEELMTRLRTPVDVTLRHPRTGESETLALRQSMAAFAIRLLTYSQETASLVPLLLRTAAEGDLAPLAAQFLMTSGEVEETISDAMGFSVICSEDFPFLDEAEIAARNEGTYLGAVQTDSLKKLCPLWPRGEIPADFKKPVRSDVPVLLLSGEADPVTPPSNGEIVASTLKNSLHLVARGQGHMVIHRGCIPRLAAELVDAGTLDGLDAACVDDIEPQPFFTRFSGPLP